MLLKTLLDSRPVGAYLELAAELGVYRETVCRWTSQGALVSLDTGAITIPTGKPYPRGFMRILPSERKLIAPNIWTVYKSLEVLPEESARALTELIKHPEILGSKKFSDFLAECLEKDGK